MTDQRIGILGSGDVAKALGRGFAKHGREVKLGTRTPEKLRTWSAETEGTVSVGSFSDAASFGDVVVLAVLGAAAEDVLELAGSENVAGKLVLDTTNPLDFSGDGPPGLLFGGTDSSGERVQAALPDAHVVKCFNTVSNAQMVDPEFEGETPPMMICGDDDDAKARTEAILTEFGWPGALDVGPIESSRYLEALVPLWVRIGANLDTWKHAFAVAR
ncbi:NADPH-dependent F420 reductase [Haladaptatus salinisoli]|uniref:NADPH-dependent F420 reductase n=1 Tax=Haladaptatus salinisoli TaxID=2884876 RepID=UPI001D0AE3ED|nr:NAD(P)-binding domain-containing protein [Haladaptatus salinisoli]